MAGGGSGGGPFSGGDDEGRMITDINVTPLVDITLVLLIIFMVTTSYIVNPSIKVDLPRSTTGTEQSKSALALTIKVNGSLYLNGEPATESGVEKYIRNTIASQPDLQALLAADKDVPHGRVVEMIDLVRKAGVRKFAINVEKAGSAVDPTEDNVPPSP